MSEAVIRRQNNNLLVRVRLQPNASMDRLEGLASDAAGIRFLKARVRAVPEKGKANLALEKLIAKAVGLPRSAVSVVKGGTDRVKTLRIETAHADTQNAIMAKLTDQNRCQNRCQNPCQNP